MTNREEVEGLVRKIHQTLKRGESTQDHGLIGNLKCILDHVLPHIPYMDEIVAPAEKPQAEPVAWIVYTKDRKFTRGIYENPSPESFEIWRLDGDIPVPLYSQEKP